MKRITPYLLAVLCALSFSLAAQVESIDEIEFELDSVVSPYRSAGQNFVFLRSKRGSSGLNKTPQGDAIVNSEVTEIVLVFSEIHASAISEREEANRERWENLLKTYPQFFQFSTTYKSICQCNVRGDSVAFKQKQGFYVYVNGEVPKAEDVKDIASTPPPVHETAKPQKTESPGAATPAKKEEKPVSAAPEIPGSKTAADAEKATAVAIAVVKTEEKTKTNTETEAVQEEAPAAAEPVKTNKKSKTNSSKPRKSSDPKACRQPCYGYGDEDFIAFFKDNMPLSKKEKRKAKGWVANVRLQIHFDGSIKKAMVTGSNQDFNSKVEDVLKKMNNWNAAVKNGLAVKSEVKFTLKFDKESKSMKPADIMLNPRLSPKCRCMTDSELFGD